MFGRLLPRFSELFVDWTNNASCQQRFMCLISEATFSFVETATFMKRAKTFDEIVVAASSKLQSGEPARKPKRLETLEGESASSESSVCQVMFASEPIVQVNIS